jgi:hypothetical protein
VALLALVVVACSDCDRDGCEAMHTPSRSSVETGIAGSVASLSDTSMNDCQECPFAATTLELWHTEALVTTVEERDTIVSRAADQAVEADASYSAPLEPGNYLVCEADVPCVAFQLRDGDRITINVKRRYGPTGFIVFDARGKRQEEIFDFAALAAPE